MSWTAIRAIGWCSCHFTFLLFQHLKNPALGLLAFDMDAMPEGKKEQAPGSEMAFGK
jgi:hypothetical protein